MRKIIILLFLITTSLQAWRITGATEKQKKTILQALRVYRDLHAGRFKIKNKVKNNTKVSRTLIVCGERFRWIDYITVPRSPHCVGLSAGFDSVGIRYGYTVWRGLGLSILYNSRDTVLLELFLHF